MNLDGPRTCSASSGELWRRDDRLCIVIDAHVDTIQHAVDLGHDLVHADDDGFMDLERMKAGNLTAAFFAVCVTNARRTLLVSKWSACFHPNPVVPGRQNRSARKRTVCGSALGQKRWSANWRDHRQGCAGRAERRAASGSSLKHGERPEWAYFIARSNIVAPPRRTADIEARPSVTLRANRTRVYRDKDFA